MHGVSEKNRNRIGYIILALFLFPLGFIIGLLIYASTTDHCYQGSREKMFDIEREAYMYNLNHFIGDYYDEYKKLPEVPENNCIVKDAPLVEKLEKYAKNEDLSGLFYLRGEKTTNILCKDSVFYWYYPLAEKSFVLCSSAKTAKRTNTDLGALYKIVNEKSEKDISSQIKSNIHEKGWFVENNLEVKNPGYCIFVDDVMKFIY
jgi:hypothetical protein